VAARIVLAAVVASLVAPAAFASSLSPERAACTPGVRTIGGHTARVFCGPAKATVKSSAQTMSFKGGSCTKTPQYFTINIGTALPGVTSGAVLRLPYFGLTVGRVPVGGGKPAGKDGTYTGGVVSWRFKGKTGSLGRATVKLTNNRTKGTFNGRAIIGGGNVSGTFSC
jgi:hypothetical protein